MAANMACLTLTVLLYSRLVLSTPAIPFSNTTTPPLSTSMNTSFPIAPANISSNATAPIALDPTVTNCFITLPDNALTAEGLATPFLLMPPCSMTVGTQQAFAEAAVFDPATGEISIYHPLIIDAAKTPAVAPVVPSIPAGASVALWFGFNGDTLQLLDTKGQDTNASPTLAASRCFNGQPGVKGDIFGQVSWCNTDAFFQSASASIASGKTLVPPLGVDHTGQDCPSSRSFTVVDQDPSDNLPTQYLLLPDGSTLQDTASNRAQFPNATVINNASDEALIGDVIDPLIGCTPFKVNSLDDPGTKVSSLATQEIQAGQYQKTPLALIPIGDPDCLLTASGSISTSKTNNYRIGVNQPLLGAANSDNGDTLTFCNNMVEIAPPWLLSQQSVFIGHGSPDPSVGNNLFTFLCNRYLQSFTNLACTPTATQTLACQLDDDGVATSCTIEKGTNSTASVTTSTASSTSLTASGVSSTASGVSSTASGISSTASGISLTAPWVNSTASGMSSTASGISSTASATTSQPTTMLTSTVRSSSVVASAGSSSLSSSVGSSVVASAGSSSLSSSVTSTLSSSSSSSSSSTGGLGSSSSKVSALSSSSSLNTATITISATSVPVQSKNPHTTFPYQFPRHHHHGGFHGHGFNPVTVAHATGTAITAFGTSTTTDNQVAATAVSSQQDVAVGASSSSSSMLWFPYSSGGTTPSFVTITMTVYATASAACGPGK